MTSENPGVDDVCSLVVGSTNLYLSRGSGEIADSKLDNYMQR